MAAPTLRTSSFGIGRRRATRILITGKIRVLVVAAAVILSAGGTPVARGSTITYQFTGTITSAAASTGVTAGTPFSGFFSYDPATVTGAITYEGHSQVHYGSAGFPSPPEPADALSIQIAGHPVFQEVGGLMITRNFIDYPGQFGYKDAQGNPQLPYTTLGIIADLDSGPRAALSLQNPNLSVPFLFNQAGALSLSDFPIATMQIVSDSHDSPPNVLYAGTIETLTPVTVPEPALAPLVCAAAGAWFVQSRRSSRRP